MDAFLTTAEPNADPGAMMRQLLVATDGPTYVKAATDLLCRAKVKVLLSKDHSPAPGFWPLCFLSEAGTLRDARPVSRSELLSRWMTARGSPARCA